jgi:hypothetical protein
MTTKDITNDMKITGNVTGDIAGRTITVSKSGSVNGSLGADRAYHKIVHYMEEDKPTEARKLA